MFVIPLFIILRIKNFVPTFVVDAPGGGGKISLQPNYILSQSPDKTVLRNYEGVITTYPEPETYTAGTADDYFQQIYGAYPEERGDGVLGLLHDKQFNLVPKDLPRYHKREGYAQAPDHSSLKDKREKRDQLKEKKFMAQQKPTPKVEEGGQS